MPYSLVSALLKHSKPGRKRSPVVYFAFPPDMELCPVTLLRVYVAKRDSLLEVDVQPFFITHQRPYHAAAKDTLARWVKQTLRLAGVDTDCFGPHSCRSASSSKAFATGASLHSILKSGQWSTAGTFYKHYRKQILTSDIDNTKEFAESILRSSRE